MSYAMMTAPIHFNLRSNCNLRKACAVLHAILQSKKFTKQLCGPGQKSIRYSTVLSHIAAILTST